MNNPLARFSLLFVFAAPLLHADNDRVQVGKPIVVRADETVNDVVCVGCPVRVAGRVNGDVVAVSGSVEIEGSVREDVVAVGGVVRLGPEASVGGDVVAPGGRIDRDPEAHVGGDIVRGWPPMAGAGLGLLLLLGLILFAAINVVLALLCFAIAGPQRVLNIAQAITQRTGLALLTGLALAAGATVLCVFFGSLAGPAAPVLCLLVSLLLFITMVLGYTGLSSGLGQRLVGAQGPYVAVLVGALVITVLQLIPLLGLLAWAAFMLLALGGAALSGLGSATDWLPRQLSARPAPR